ncbi:hypothetical protein BLOT_005252 [Blomia tropicalis]|nr:hypothetical protein BLOT_005252 [Blomia tropicalis]
MDVVNDKSNCVIEEDEVEEDGLKYKFVQSQFSDNLTVLLLSSSLFFVFSLDCSSTVLQGQYFTKERNVEAGD